MGKDWIQRIIEAGRKLDKLDRPEPMPMLNLKSLREATGLTQSQLAERLCTSRSSISYLERSGNKCSIENLIAFANACGGQLELSFHSPYGHVFKLCLESTLNENRAL